MKKMINSLSLRSIKFNQIKNKKIKFKIHKNFKEFYRNKIIT